MTDRLYQTKAFLCHRLSYLKLVYCLERNVRILSKTINTTAVVRSDSLGYLYQIQYLIVPYHSYVYDVTKLQNDTIIRSQISSHKTIF